MSFSLDTVDSDILAQSWGPSESICRQARCHVTAHCHVSRVAVTRSPGACRTRGRRGPSSAVLCHQARLSRLRLAGPKQFQNKKQIKFPSLPVRGSAASCPAVAAPVLAAVCGSCVLRGALSRDD